MPPTSTTNPASETDKPPRRRRRIPVGLRLFVALLGLFGVGSAIWIGARVYRHQMAIREIKQVGGSVELEIDAPDWIRGEVDDSWLTAFEKIAVVQLPFSEALDSKVPHLLALRPLPRLQISGGPPVLDLIRAGRLDEARSLLLKHRILLFSVEGLMGETPLHVAVHEGDFDIPQRVEFVEFLLGQGSEIDAIFGVGDTPLRLAVQPAVVKLLLDHGASVAPRGPNRDVVWHAACRFDLSDGEDQQTWLEITHLLRAAGAECNMISACWIDDVDRVRELLKRGDSGSERQHALQVAVDRGRTQIVKLLLEHGVNPNDDSHYLPVTILGIEHPDMLELLFAYRADPNVTYDLNGASGWTLLHAAAEAGVVESARLVLNRGVSVNVRDDEWETPLHVAARKGNVEVVKLLLDHHADPGARTNAGITAISLGAVATEIEEYSFYGDSISSYQERPLADRRKVVELLLAAGEPPDLFTAIALGRIAEVREFLVEQPELANSRDCRGTSPLNRAVNLDYAEIVMALLEGGADINEAGRTYDMPLHVAVKLRREQIVKILIAHGADVNATGEDRQAPLHDATLRLEPEMVRLLLAAGANPNAKGFGGNTPLDFTRLRCNDDNTEAERLRASEIIRLLEDVPRIPAGN